MKYQEYVGLRKGLKLVSPEVGILSYIAKLPPLQFDPKLISYGIWPCDTTCLGGLRYAGRSSGCGYKWEHAVLSTLGEVVERYCPAFYNKKDLIRSSYKNLTGKAVKPSEVALFHPKQYENLNFPFVPFTEDHELHWVACNDLINGGEVLFPGSLIYMPWIEREDFIGLSTSTGLAGHTNIHDAILIGLYEVIERDSFVLTWMQELDVPKIIIDDDTQKFLDENYPKNFEFHFFDVTFDLGVPTVFGMMFGEADYGSFVSVGSAARGTYGEALQKVIQEMGQTVSYFRYLLSKRKDWEAKDFNEINNFEDHSIFYIKRKDLWHVFDKWRNSKPSKKIDFNEKRTNTVPEEIKRILKIMDNKGYDVLFKNLTTPDIHEAGFCSVKVIVPQLIQMAGSYHTYFSGGKRLYEVPKQLGYITKEYDDLNKYPHPFP